MKQFNTLLKIRAALFVLASTSFIQLNAQEPKRFSLDLAAGLPFPMMSVPGKMSINTDIGIRYSINHYLSFQALYSTGLLRGGNAEAPLAGSNPTESQNIRSFRNYYNSGSINAQLNLTRAFGIKALTNRYAPYLTAGMGRMFSDLQKESFSGGVRSLNNFDFYIYHYGLINRFRINNNFDFMFSAVYYGSQTAYLDLIFDDARYDKFLSVNAGITYKIGGGNTRDLADWAERRKRKQRQQRIEDSDSDTKPVAKNDPTKEKTEQEKLNEATKNSLAENKDKAAKADNKATRTDETETNDKSSSELATGEKKANGTDPAGAKATETKNGDKQPAELAAGEKKPNGAESGATKSTDPKVGDTNTPPQNQVVTNNAQNETKKSSNYAGAPNSKNETQPNAQLNSKPAIAANPNLDNKGAQATADKANSANAKPNAGAPNKSETTSTTTSTASTPAQLPSDISLPIKKYNVIVNSFRNTNYARTFADKMRKQGHEVHLIKFTAEHEYTRICILTTDDRKEAIKALQAARIKINPETWLFVKPDQ